MVFLDDKTKSKLRSIQKKNIVIEKRSRSSDRILIIKIKLFPGSGIIIFFLKSLFQFFPK